METHNHLLPNGCGGDLIMPANAYRRDRLPWLRMRHRGLGASEVGAALGFKPGWTSQDVWEEKTGPAPVEDVVLNEAAEWGKALEDPIAREVARRHPQLGKLVPSPGLLRHREHPWMLATVDRLLAPSGQRYAPVHAVLEVKAVSVRGFKRDWNDGVPPAVFLQVQQQLAVTGLPVAYVAVLIGGAKLAPLYRIEADPAVIKALTHHAGKWWADHVQTGEQPTTTGPCLGVAARLPELQFMQLALAGGGRIGTGE